MPSLAVQGAPGEAGERPDGPERAPSTTSTVHRLGLTLNALLLGAGGLGAPPFHTKTGREESLRALAVRGAGGCGFERGERGVLLAWSCTQLMCACTESLLLKLEKATLGSEHREVIASAACCHLLMIGASARRVPLWAATAPCFEGLDEAMVSWMRWSWSPHRTNPSYWGSRISFAALPPFKVSGTRYASATDRCSGYAHLTPFNAGHLADDPVREVMTCDHWPEPNH